MNRAPRRSAWSFLRRPRVEEEVTPTAEAAEGEAAEGAAEGEGATAESEGSEG